MISRNLRFKGSAHQKLNEFEKINVLNRTQIFHAFKVQQSSKVETSFDK